MNLSKAHRCPHHSTAPPPTLMCSQSHGLPTTLMCKQSHGPHPHSTAVSHMAHPDLICTQVTWPPPHTHSTAVSHMAHPTLMCSQSHGSPHPHVQSVTWLTRPPPPHREVEVGCPLCHPHGHSWVIAGAGGQQVEGLRGGGRVLWAGDQQVKGQVPGGGGSRVLVAGGQQVEGLGGSLGGGGRGAGGHVCG